MANSGARGKEHPLRWAAKLPLGRIAPAHPLVQDWGILHDHSWGFQMTIDVDFSMTKSGPL
jgi:hypothetical protein